MSGVRLLVPVSRITVYECRGGEGKYSSRSGLSVLLLILSTSGMRLESEHHHAEEGDVELPTFQIKSTSSNVVASFPLRSKQVQRRDSLS